MRRLIAVLALPLAFACTNSVTIGEGEGEGEGEGGEGEGEGEGEPVRETPTARVTLSPLYPLPADGVSALALTVQLIGTDIGARSVNLATVEPGPAELAAITSDETGKATFALTSTVHGTFTLEVEVDGVLTAVEADTVVFSACWSLEETFLRETWPVALSRCVGCHNEFGFGPSSGARFILPFPGGDDFGARGVQAVRSVLAATAADSRDTEVTELDDERKAALLVSDADASIPLLLMNPIFADVHTGGVVITPLERQEIARLRAFVARVQAGADTCAAGTPNSVAFEDLLALTTSLPPREVYKRAQLALTGQNAPPATLTTIVDEQSLGAALDTLLANNRRVEERLGEIWNDWLLTNAKAGDTPSYLGNAFPRRTFFEPLASEGARGQASCNDAVAANCCRVPEDPLNLDANPDNDVPPKPENVACNAKRLELRQSAGREPIEILKRIWRDQLPAETMLTGDWTVVNPSLAIAYGLLADNGRTFLDGTTQAFNINPADDATELRRVRITTSARNAIAARGAGLTGWVHQGIMSTPAFLTRYPNTASNRERTRARVVFENFLGVSVMKLAAFATPEIPAGQSLENLTWDTQPCIVCHTVIDPVASIFNHFPNSNANLTLRSRCRLDGMRAPGFGLVALPGSGEPGEGLYRPALDDDNDCVVPDPATGAGQGELDTRHAQRMAWLADRVVEHPRFAYAVVVPLYEGIIGQKLISAPDSLIDPDFDPKARAFIAQQREIAALIAAFRAGDGRLQPVVKAILLSRSFRADTTSADTDPGTARTLELVGIGHKSKLLTAELLDRRIELLTGLPWNRVRNPNQLSLLGAGGQYNVFFGGIDSETVTLRSRDPVAIRAAVARRMGHEVACVLVPQEFAIVDAAERTLFRNVEPGELPIRVDGVPDEAAETRVRAQIRRLHNVLWQEAEVDEAEVEASYALFLAALNELRTPADGSTTLPAIGGTCQAASKFVATPDGVRPPFPATGTVVIDGVEHRRVTTDATFTVRAWMAVTSAILADARFLFE